MTKSLVVKQFNNYFSQLSALISYSRNGIIFDKLAWKGKHEISINI